MGGRDQWDLGLRWSHPAVRAKAGVAEQRSPELSTFRELRCFIMQALAKCNAACATRKLNGRLVVQHKKDMGHRCPCAQPWGGWERGRQVSFARYTPTPPLTTPHGLPGYIDTLLSLEQYGSSTSMAFLSCPRSGPRDCAGSGYNLWGGLYLETPM